MQVFYYMRIIILKKLRLLNKASCQHWLYVMRAKVLIWMKLH